MLSVQILLSSRNLDLDVGLSLPVPTSHRLSFLTAFDGLLFPWTVEVLLGRIHNLVGWRRVAD